MANKAYTQEQISILRSNPCVAGCTQKFITFTTFFRKEAVRLYEYSQLTPRKIFSDFGFPEFVVRSEIPKSSLKRWRKLVKNLGPNALDTQKRGRKPGGGKKDGVREEKLHLLSPEDQIVYLKAQVEYLKAEIAFRKGLRAKENYH